MSIEIVLAPAVIALATLGIRALPSLFGPELEDFWARISRWLLQTVGVSISPVLIDYVGMLAKGNGDAPLMTNVIKHGELCLIATALASVAAGEIVGLSSKGKIAKVILSGLCTISVVAGIALYVIMKLVASEQTEPLLSTMSLYLLAETVFVSTASIAVSGLRK